MTRIITNIGASIQDKLKNKAKECGVPNNKMITKYLLERFIYRLSISQYADNFVLKGSVLSTLFITDSKFIRPTKDVDFLAKNISNSLENISRVMSDVAKIEYPNDGVVFHPETIKVVIITEEKEYNGVRVSMIAELSKIRERISFDISYDEVVTPSPKKNTIYSIFDDMPNIHIFGYTIETVIAEKIESMVKKGVINTRMKDFYDVWNLMQHANVDVNVLKRAITNTFEHRNTNKDVNSVVFKMEFYTMDKNRLKLWQAFLTKHKIPYIDFVDIGMFICNNVKKLL